MYKTYYFKDKTTKTYNLDNYNFYRNNKELCAGENIEKARCINISDEDFILLNQIFNSLMNPKCASIYELGVILYNIKTTYYYVFKSFRYVC